MKPGIVIVPAVGLLAGAVMATMTPANLQDTANSLAFQAFDAKDLVLTINSTLNAGPMQVGRDMFPYFPRFKTDSDTAI